MNWWEKARTRLERESGYEARGVIWVMIQCLQACEGDGENVLFGQFGLWNKSTENM